MSPGAGHFLTQGAWLAGFIKRTITHCYIQNIKALGLVVSEKKIFVFVFSHDAPGAVPVWTPGGTAGRIYKDDHYTLLHTKYESSGLAVSGKIFFMFSHYMSMAANDPRGGAIYYPRGMVGRIYKEDYTLLYTKYESSGHCGFGEEDFFMLFL